MDRRAAMRRAKWVAAGYIRSCLEGGADVSLHTDGDEDSADTRRVCEALTELVLRLEREGEPGAADRPMPAYDGPAYAPG